MFKVMKKEIKHTHRELKAVESITVAAGTTADCAEWGKREESRNGFQIIRTDQLSEIFLLFNVYCFLHIRNLYGNYQS